MRLVVGERVLLWVLTHVGFMEFLVSYEVALDLISRTDVFIKIDKPRRI